MGRLRCLPARLCWAALHFAPFSMLEPTSVSWLCDSSLEFARSTNQISKCDWASLSYGFAVRALGVLFFCSARRTLVSGRTLVKLLRCLFCKMSFRARKECSHSLKCLSMPHDGAWMDTLPMINDTRTWKPEILEVQTFSRREKHRNVYDFSN